MCTCELIRVLVMGFSLRISWPCRTVNTPPPTLYSNELCMCVCECVRVCEHVFMSVAAAAAALFFHPFSFKLTCLFISVSSVSTFLNLSSVLPVCHCYLSWRMPFLAWSSFSGFSVTTVLVCLVINCVSLYLLLVALGLVKQGWAWVPASPN